MAVKNISVLLAIFIFHRVYTQQTIVPLRTYGIENKECYYFKDTDNELPAYEGIWKGSWNGKTIFITFKKVINQYNESLKYSRDYLIGKFKTIDNNGNPLFDNTSLSDDDSKIKWGGFQNMTNDYLITYIDNELCGLTGTIYIKFANSSKTQLNFSFHQDSQVIDSDCYFHGWPQADRPQPLPKTNIILTKQ